MSLSVIPFTLKSTFPVVTLFPAVSVIVAVRFSCDPTVDVTGFMLMVVFSVLFSSVIVLFRSCISCCAFSSCWVRLFIVWFKSSSVLSVASISSLYCLFVSVRFCISSCVFFISCIIRQEKQIFSRNKTVRKRLKHFKP